MRRRNKGIWELFHLRAFLWRKSPRRFPVSVPLFQFARLTIMLNLVVTLLIIALIAAVLGFGGIASAAVNIAQVVFFVALLLFLIAAVAGLSRGPRAL
jgi:uncharacterized membrane protein YtjA (UPF0391 family)